MENENSSAIYSDHMVKILQKENDKLKAQLFKQKEYKDNLTLSSLLEVLQFQRQKIDSLELKNKKMIQRKVMLLEKLKGLEIKSQSQTFANNINSNKADYSAISSKSQAMRSNKTHNKKNNNSDEKSNDPHLTLLPSKKFKKRKVKMITNSLVVEKNNKEKETSKIPYDYDNLMALSLNGLKNKTKQHQ